MKMFVQNNEEFVGVLIYSFRKTDSRHIWALHALFHMLNSTCPFLLIILTVSMASVKNYILS